MGQDSFVFYRSFYKAIKKLDNNTLAEAVRAICAYALDGEEPTLDGVAEIIFDMARPQIDANTKRRTDGQKGGRPKKEKPVVSENKNHRFSEKKPNVNVNVNENVNVNANENVNVNENGNVNEKIVVRKFTPPTLDEVKDYCRERNNHVDPQRFIDFYSMKGWMVGKNKMKDWKAAVRTWEKNDNGGSESNIDDFFRRKMGL